MLTMFPPVAYLQVSESGQAKAPGMLVVSHLRHAAEQLELLEHSVDFTDIHACATSDTTLTGRVQDGRTAPFGVGHRAVSYTHLRAHETRHDLVCRLLL